MKRMFKLTTTTIFSYNFYYKSRADFVVRLLLVNGPSSSSDFFTGRVRWTDFSMGRLHLKARFWHKSHVTLRIVLPDGDHW